MGFLSALVGGVVGFFVGGPAGAVIGAGLGATKVGEKVVNQVMDFVLQPFMPNIPEMGVGDEAERQQGVLVQRTGSTVNVPVVYGYRKLGGTIVFAETGSTKNKYLYVAYVFAEGVVEGLREVYIDDWLLPTDQVGSLNAGQLVTVNSDRYKDRVQMRWYPGVYYTNPKTSTVGSTVKGDIFAEAPSFVKEMNYNGLAVLFARYEWKDIKTQAEADSNPFKGNIPEIQVALLGKRVASLLVNDTENFAYDANTVRYSTNPAECLLDYLRNPRYGKGLVNNDINWATWKNAARKCNQTVTYVASGITGPVLTMNIVLDSGTTLMANTKTMLQNFRAYMPYVQGKYKLMIEDAGNTYDILSGSALIVQTFTKDDIVSDITFNGIDRSSKYNVVSVTYVDPDQKFSNQTVVYPETEAERQIYIDKDGGRENKYDVTLGGITNYAIAKDMARLIFNKQRYQESCVFTATSKALELEPGDCIRIQSNLLNFGTDAWRVISVKINGDMTVDLGCVRNPDFIYPYVRVGEEDFVVPTYVPKGSIIYYPSSDNRISLGLVPPMYAVFPPDAVPVMTNPVATNPDLLGGGGVGGGANGGSTAGPIQEVTTVTTPNPTTTTAPSPAPVIPPFNTILAYKSTKYTKNDASTGLFTVTFTQPSDALYDYSTLWWRPNAFTAWTTIRLDNKPGAGGDISFTVGPLANLGQYEYYARSYASDGRASASVTKGYFRAIQSQTIAGELLGNGAGSSQSVSEGWTVPTSQVPSNPVYNDMIDFLEIRPKLTGGSPQNPRRLSVTMTQLLYTFTSPVNPLIDGIYVYYKYKDDEFWNREELLIPANKSIQETISWDLAGDFGSPAYPDQAIYSATAYQNYDFIVRLKYKDGTTAEKQMGPARASVEQSGVPPTAGLYNFVVFGTEPTAVASVKSTVIPSGFTIPLLTQQDPSLVYNTGQDLMPNFYKINANGQTSAVYFRFNPPTNNKFRGYRLRYRPIIAGSDPDFITVDIPPTVKTDGYVYFDLTSNYNHSTKYEWMITALYSNNLKQTVDANNCWYCRASIPFGLGSNIELLNNYFNFETKDTNTTLGQISDAFPAVAAVIPQKWIKKQLVKQVSSDSSFIPASGTIFSNTYDVKKDTTGQPRLNAWYQLQFQAPNQTFTSLIVYRRVYSASGAARTTIGTYSKYWELGPWEKVVIPRTSLTHLGSGVYTADVRGPISPYAFNSKPTGGLWKPIYASTGYYPGPGYTGLLQLTSMYPYYGTGQGSTNRTAEFLFVLDDGGEGTKGLRLTDFYTDASGATTAGYKAEVDGIQSANQPRDDYRIMSDYNSFDAGYGRNLDEAITTVTVGQLAADDFGNTYPKIDNLTYKAWKFYLANPSGLTVY